MINELLFWAAHSSDDAAWRIYMHKVGALIVRRAVTTHGVCTHRVHNRPRTHAAICQSRERKKTRYISLPQKYLKSLPQTAACVCVWFLSSIIYWDQFFDQSTRTTRIPCPQVANYRVRARGLFQEEKFYISCDCFSSFCFSFFSLSLPGVCCVARERAAWERRTLSREKDR